MVGPVEEAGEEANATEAIPNSLSSDPISTGREWRAGSPFDLFLPGEAFLGNFASGLRVRDLVESVIAELTIVTRFSSAAALSKQRQTGSDVPSQLDHRQASRLVIRYDHQDLLKIELRSCGGIVRSSRSTDHGLLISFARESTIADPPVVGVGGLSLQCPEVP